MKRKSKKRAKAAAKRAPSDKALIRECVIYAQSTAAFQKGFKADPDGNSTQAAALGDRHSNRAWQALTKITATPATTPEGLCSKARVAAIVFEDNEGGCFENADLEFLKSFAAEVKKFLQPICDGDVMLQKPAAERRDATADNVAALH